VQPVCDGVRDAISSKRAGQRVADRSGASRPGSLRRNSRGPKVFPRKREAPGVGIPDARLAPTPIAAVQWPGSHDTHPRLRRLISTRSARRRASRARSRRAVVRCADRSCGASLVSSRHNSVDARSERTPPSREGADLADAYGRRPAGRSPARPLIAGGLLVLHPTGQRVARCLGPGISRRERGDRSERSLPPVRESGSAAGGRRGNIRP
jgi:hypothetical protein